MCKRGYSEDIISKTPELVFSNSPEGHSEVDVDFAVYSRFAKVKVLISQMPMLRQIFQVER